MTSQQQVAVPSSMTNTSRVCNVYFEEFTEIYDLTLSESCPECGIAGTRHLRRPNTITSSHNNVNEADSNTSTSGLTAASNAFIKLASQFPTWDKTTECKQFLKRLEMVLEVNVGDRIPKSSWPLALMHIIKDRAAAEWINTNIIKQNLSWDETKKEFTIHFQRAETSAIAMKNYHSCRQKSDENVQSYSDRFESICEDLGREDYNEDILVIDHYLHGLNATIRQKYEDHLALKRIEEDTVEYSINDLKKVMRICIIYDIKSGSSLSLHNNKSNNERKDKQNNNNSSGSTQKKMWCEFHKSKTHNTADCRNKNNPQAGSSLPTSQHKQKDKSSVQCRKCEQYGHYANECTNKAANQNNKQNTITPTNNYEQESKRQPVPRKIFTYDEPGKPAGVAGKTATVKQTNQSTSLFNNITSASRVWLCCSKSNELYTM